MAEQPKPTVSHRDVVRILYRHKKKLVAFLFCTTLLAGLVIFFCPRSYVSEAKFFIRVGRETVALDPTATTGETLPIRKSQESEISSIVEILESRRIAERVVQTLGADTILTGAGLSSADGGRSTPDSACVAPWARDLTERVKASKNELMSRLRLRSPVTDEEKATERVMKLTQVWAPTDSTVITVEAKAASPELAQRIVETMTDVFLQEHVRLNRTEGSHQFFVEQTQILEEQLAKVTQQLRDCKNQYGLLTVEGKRTVLEGMVSDVELERLQLERSIASSGAKIRDLKKELKELEPILVTETVAGFSNMARDGMRQQLYDLEIRERELSAKYAPEHYLVKQVQQQRRDVEEILKTELPQRTQTTTAINPNYQALELELKTELANLGSLQSRRDALALQYDRVRAELARLNDQEIAVADLQRELETLEVSYRTNLDKREQARIDEALALERISNVNIVQPATYVGKPAGPNTRVALAVALLMAIVGGVGLVVAAEIVDGTLRTPEQTATLLGLPVLLSIPKVASKRAILYENGYGTCPVKQKSTRRDSVAEAVLHGEFVH